MMTARVHRTARWMMVMCAAAFLVVGAEAAEESTRTPSDQMKDAMVKMGKAPATLGKSLQDLTDAAKDRLQQTFGGKTRSEHNAATTDLTVPKQAPAPGPSLKMNSSQRDPFRPMTLRTKGETTRRRENLSPLERLELSQLKLVGIVWDIKEPRAMVEDSTGLGYVLRVGTPIGSNDGRVKVIHRNEVIVEEFYSDDSGARKKRDVGMKLMTE